MACSAGLSKCVVLHANHLRMCLSTATLVYAQGTAILTNCEHSSLLNFVAECISCALRDDTDYNIYMKIVALKNIFYCIIDIMHDEFCN